MQCGAKLGLLIIVFYMNDCKPTFAQLCKFPCDCLVQTGKLIEKTM